MADDGTQAATKAMWIQFMIDGGAKPDLRNLDMEFRLWVGRPVDSLSDDELLIRVEYDQRAPGKRPGSVASSEQELDRRTSR